MAYFLGADGGGTKTTAIVTDENGIIVAKAVGESINYNSVGYSAAQRHMKTLAEHLMQQIGCDCFESACIGMSAISEKASREETKAFFSGVINCKHQVMDSDLAIAMASMLCDEACAMVISGTGSMVVGKDQNGNAVHTGGWGYILGDEGSGYQLAIDALRAGIVSYEHSGPASMLTRKMMEYYQVSDMLKIIDVFYDPPMERHEIAKFVSVLFDCAAQDDAVSVQIIENQAKKLADTTIALLQKLPQNIKIGIWGGVFVHHEDYLNAFKKHIRTYNSGYQIEILKYPPEIGAVLYAMTAADLKINDQILLNMEKTLNAEVTDEKIG